MKTELKIKDKINQTEGIKIAEFRKDIRKTSPHKHNSYFEIIYLTQGSGTHTIDTVVYDIKPPIAFAIRKEQVHFWDIQDKPEGFVIIIKKSFIDSCLDKDIKQLISELSSHTCLLPKDTSLNDMFRLLLNVYEKEGKTNRPVFDGLLKALLGTLLESAATSHSKKANNSLFQNFLDLLNQEGGLINKVNHYAELLNTSPQNLNAICKKEMDRSATEILSEYIINEAKRYLIYSDFTVSEIAFRLNFKDNSHFSKFFKRHVGNTPMVFRNDME